MKNKYIKFNGNKMTTKGYSFIDVFKIAEVKGIKDINIDLLEIDGETGISKYYCSIDGYFNNRNKKDIINIIREDNR